MKRALAVDEKSKSKSKSKKSVKKQQDAVDAAGRTLVVTNTDQSP
jgi:hypothetical protein